MNKEFKIKAQLSTEDFDRSIQEMVKKLKDVSQPINAMQQNTAQRMQQQGLGGMSATSMEAFQKATNAARREMDQLISSQAKEQEKLGKFIAQRAESIKEMVNQQKKLNKETQEYKDIQEKIIRTQANQQALKEQYRQRDAMINQALDAREQMRPRGLERLSTAYNKGGIKGGITALGRMAIQSPMATLGVAGTALGAVGSAINVGADIYDQVARSPFRTRINTGAAMEGTIGRTIGDMGTAYGQAWRPERLKAVSESGRQDEISRNYDRAKLAAGSAMVGGGAAVAAGGTATVLGAIPSWLAGGASIAGGLGTIFGGQRTRSLAFSGMANTLGEGIDQYAGGGFGAGNWLKGIGDQQMKQYNSMLAKEFADNFQSALAAEQQINPLKKLAAETYQQNYMGNLATQRGLGLDYYGFYGKGGFAQRSIDAGFTTDMAQGMSSSILGAGGSTRMGRDSITGLQLQKGLDLTNASQVLGTLSGSIGSSETTKQATIKILAEGMKLGLNESEFTEENRKFTQSVAEIVAKSGTKVESDFERIAGGFGRFLSDNTNAGIEGAKTAYGQYQEISSATSGPRGAMRAAGFMRDEKLNKLPVMTKQALMQLPENELNADNPLVLSAALANGMEPEDLISRISKINQGSVSRFGTVDKAKELLKSKNFDISKIRDKEYLSKLPQEQLSALSTMTSGLGVDTGTLGTQGDISRLTGFYRGEWSPDKQQLGRENVISDKMTRDTGRDEDKTIANIAESSRLALDSFRQFHKEIVPTLESIKQFNDGIQKAAKAMESMSPENKNQMNNILIDILKLNPTNQQQAGKPSK